MKQIIHIKRRLPAPGHWLFAVGEHVAHDEIVGKIDYSPGPLVRIDTARQLGVAPAALPKHMVGKVDDYVQQGERIAHSHEFFWDRYVESPIDGYLALWSRFLGTVYVRVPLAAEAREPVVISAEAMGITRLSFAERILVAEGQLVNTGQPLLRGMDAVAPMLCSVEHVSLAEGKLVLVPLFQPTQVQALMEGHVTEIPEASLCIISSVGHRFLGEVGYGGEASGTLRPVLGDSRDLDAADIPTDISGCIVVARGGITETALAKLAELEISGLALGTINPVVLAAFCQDNPLHKLGILMKTPFPLILLQGFSGPMPEHIYDQLESLQGRRSALDASTQLRAGVVRPELLVPLPEENFVVGANSIHPQGGGYVVGEIISRPPYVGARVILKRDPYLGSEGFITAIQAKREATEAGTLATLAHVQLDDGSLCKVPLANCQLLPEEHVVPKGESYE